MIKEIRFSEEFDRAFKRLKKRYRSLENPRQGAELYNGMRKVRISFASKGRGKRGGGRVIIQLTVSEDSLTFVYIYDKADMQNVSENFLDQVIKDVGEGRFNSVFIDSPEA